MAKTLTPEIDFIRLDAQSVIVTSNLGINEDITIGEDEEIIIGAPSRYNYRGMAMDWEADYDNNYNY